MTWKVPKIWEGGECWILGGGDSLVEQFNIPNGVESSVREGRLPVASYSPYLSAIHGKHVIGVNVAGLLGNWVDIVMYGDDAFYKKHQKYLQTIEGLIVSCSVRNPNDPNIKWLRREAKEHGISESAECVRWNGNTGAASISLAVHLGAKRIYLVGFDMKHVQDQSHWHCVYTKLPKNTPYERHLKGFGEIAAQAKRLGVEIINCSPTSAIKSLPKMTVKEALSLKKKVYKAPTPRIGVVTPTCSPERKPFLDFLKKRVKEQTLQPFKHYVIDYPNQTVHPDLSKRYKQGIAEAFADGCEFVVFMEDDDYYPKTYISDMYKNWVRLGKPCIIGLSTSIYYHIGNNGYRIIKTKDHTSAHNTAVGRGVKYDIGRNKDIFYDLTLWKNNKGCLVDIANKVISIKHGIGRSGGSGHRTAMYKSFDIGRKLLKDWTDNDALQLYARMTGDVSFASVIRNIHAGKVANIVATGPSLMRLTKKAITDGVVITLNEAISHVESLQLPEGVQIYSQQKDKLFLAPEKAILLLHKHESAKQNSPYHPQLVFDNEELGLEKTDFSMLSAIRIAQVMGCKKFRFFGFDSWTSGDCTTVWKDKPNPHYPIQHGRAKKYLEQIDYEFIKL